MENETQILQNKGVKPTPNRILVLRTLMRADYPMTFTQLEDALDTMDKSSIFRALGLLVEHDIVHLLEGGDGAPRYEVCHGRDHCSIADMHMHFFCTSCRRTYCFEDIPVPQAKLPEGFETKSVNYMAKGICPKCRGC